MEKFLSVLMAALVLCTFAFFALGSGTDSAEGSSSEISESASKEIGINEITKVDDFECSIKEVNWYSASDFDYDAIKREDGFEYIVVVISAKNTTKDTENAPMCYMLSADDQECLNLPVLSIYKKKYKVNLGATLPNATAEAYTIYQIPAGATSFKFQILSNGFGESSDYIVFSREDIK